MCVEGVILAAGLSKRMGVPKLLLEIGGLPIIERCILGMISSCKCVKLVLGHKPELFHYLEEKYPKIQIVINHDYMQGMFSSTKFGLAQTIEERIIITP